MSKHELDDAAYEALKAHPVMVEEAITNQDGAFWILFAKFQKDFLSHSLDELIDKAISKYVYDQVEDLASDEQISVNEAVHKLLNRCNK